MRKRRRKNKSQKLLAQRKEIRKRMRFQRVLSGLQCNLTVREIHLKTGMAEKNIRKIMKANSEEVSFALLKRNCGDKIEDKRD